LQKRLKKIAVKADNLILQRIFEQFILKGEDSFQKGMNYGNPVNWHQLNFFQFFNFLK